MSNVQYHPRPVRHFPVFLAVLLLCACEPSDRRPGLWLHGETEATLPSDWSFSDAYAEIFVEVATPYLLPHSVTIWCAQVDGRLYIGARNAESKNWPGWLEKNRAIRLKIGEKTYAVRAEDIADEAALTAVRAAYAEKYALPAATDASSPVVTYWAIAPRE